MKLSLLLQGLGPANANFLKRAVVRDRLGAQGKSQEWLNVGKNM